MSIKGFLLAIALLVVISGTGSAASTWAFYVAPNGKDTNPGTKSKPFATLNAARDAIRVIKTRSSPPAGGVTVWLRGGTYHMTDSFVVGAGDSGTEASPITYRASEGEKVLLTGGREVKNWTRVRDPQILERLDPSVRDKVIQTDLRAQGITNFGEITRRGFSAGGKAGLELFLNTNQ